MLSRLHCVQRKWLYIGLQLGIDYQKLEDIECEHLGDQRSMTKMLNIVLSQQKTVTWRHIIDSLRKPNVDEQACAQELEKSFLTQATADHERQPSSLDARDDPASKAWSPTSLNGGD